MVNAQRQLKLNGERSVNQDRSRARETSSSEDTAMGRAMSAREVPSTIRTRSKNVRWVVPRGSKRWSDEQLER